jgi:hypothetical protein
LCARPHLLRAKGCRNLERPLCDTGAGRPKICSSRCGPAITRDGRFN